MKKDIFRKIKSTRIKLEESIDKNGLNSNETRKLSDKIDKLINERGEYKNCRIPPKF